MPSLDGCLRKLCRAKDHFEALAPEIRAVDEMTAVAASAGYQIGVRFDRPKGNRREAIFKITYTAAEDVRPHWSLVVGEILLNLRCALDYLVYELSALDSGGVYNEDTQFPITDSKSDFVAAVGRGNLGGLSTGNITRIERHQPYRYAQDIRQISGYELSHYEARNLNNFKRSNEPLRTLRDLSNQDKHRLLIEGFFWASTQLHLHATCVRDCEKPKLLWSAAPPLISGTHIATYSAIITGENPEMKVDFSVPPVVVLPNAGRPLRTDF